MKPFMDSNTTNRKRYLLLGSILLLCLFFIALFVGKYPLKLEKLMAGDEMQWHVFQNLRLSRALVGCIGGFALGIAGFVFQIIFQNPLASPDIIGVSSGASAGAAAGILLFASAPVITVASFLGALAAVVCALCLSSLDRSGRKSTVILAGIAVHSLAQTILMFLKLTADPEKELASIEYWIMGSLNGINSHIIGPNLVISIACIFFLFFLHRQLILLSMKEEEAIMLGANVMALRVCFLFVATLLIACVVSLSGLISFVGLIAPHLARKLTGDNTSDTMVLAGIMGGIILLVADMFARSIAATELPVSIFTSLIGAPFLIILIMKGRQME